MTGQTNANLFGYTEIEEGKNITIESYPEDNKVKISAGLSDNDVTTDKIANKAVTGAKIADDTIGKGNLNPSLQKQLDDAVNPEIEAGANITITESGNTLTISSEIEAGSITSDMFSQEVKDELDSKQQALVVGENITIENNVISATSEFQKLDLTEAINLSTLESGAYQVTVEGYVTTRDNYRYWVSKGGLIFIESREYGYFNCFIADSSPKLISYTEGEFKEFGLQDLPLYIQANESILEFINETLPNEYATKTRIVTDADNSVIPAFELANNTEYRFTLELESIEFTLPNNPTDDYISSIVFKSGATATTITYPDTIKWSGDNMSSNKFVPAASKTYEILIYWNGFNYCGIVKGW